MANSPREAKPVLRAENYGVSHVLGSVARAVFRAGKIAPNPGGRDLMFQFLGNLGRLFVTEAAG